MYPLGILHLYTSFIIQYQQRKHRVALYQEPQLVMLFKFLMPVCCLKCVSLINYLKYVYQPKLKWYSVNKYREAQTLAHSSCISRVSTFRFASKLQRTKYMSNTRTCGLIVEVFYVSAKKYARLLDRCCYISQSYTYNNKILFLPM